MNDAERRGRGERDSKKILIKSIRSKVPTSDSPSFLSNGENKTRMIQLSFESIVKQKTNILNLLRTTVLVLCLQNECQKVTCSICEVYQELLTNQEEKKRTQKSLYLQSTSFNNTPSLKLLSSLLLGIQTLFSC